VVGTAKGLELDEEFSDGVYTMKLGRLLVTIQYEWHGGWCISVTVFNVSGFICMLFDPETLEENFEEENFYKGWLDRKKLEQWVGGIGPKRCKAEIDRIWNRGQ